MIKYSLKKVLLHNHNALPSIAIGHSIFINESLENLDRVLLKQIRYDSYNWYICGDPKVIGLLLDMQPGIRMIVASFVSGKVEQVNPTT